MSTKENLSNISEELENIDIEKILSRDDLESVAGKPGIYSNHTDGQKCDTSSGCNC